MPNLIRPSSPAVPRRFWASLFSLAAALLLATGCASTRHVREIVAESNAAALKASLGIPDMPDKATLAPGGIDPVQAIDAFIGGHTNQPRTVAALRIRQAMLLLARKEFNLAEAAFGEARPEHLVSARDTALKELAPDLIWIESNRDNQQLNATRGDQALAALERVVSRLDASVRGGAVENEEVRDRLAEIHLILAVNLSNRFPDDQRRQRIEAAVNRYAATCLSDQDIAAIRSDKWTGAAITPAIRRCARAKAWIQHVRERSSELQPRPRFQSPGIQALVFGS